jgi:hypothetical protein
MSTTSPIPGTPRPAATVNRAIRELLERTRRRLSDTERTEYEALLTEWHLATAAERLRENITTAA